MWWNSNDIWDVWIWCERCWPCWWWPRVPMVQWSLVPRPPHVTLCQPRTYLHIVKCYPWHWTHETGNTNVTTIISRKRRDGLDPLHSELRLWRLCWWFWQISRNVPDKRGRLLPGLGLNCHWDCDHSDNETQWRRYWGGGLWLTQRCLPGSPQDQWVDTLMFR